MQNNSVDAAMKQIEEKLAQPVSELELSVRIANILEEAKIKTIGDLVSKTEMEMLKYRTIGRKSLEEIDNVLISMGLSLGMKIDKKKVEEKAREPQEFVALWLFGDEIKLVSLNATGKLTSLGEPKEFFNIIHISPKTLILQKAVAELESLINNRDIKEEDLQDFFERNPDFILNDEYKKAHPKLVLKKDQKGFLQPDFILEPFEQNQLSDILDLKSPFAKAFVLKKSRERFSAAVYEACAQLREYNNFFEEEKNRKKIFQKYRLRLYKPKMLVVIGRRGNIDSIVRRRIEKFDLKQCYTVYTYDEIINRMKEKIINKKSTLRLE